MRDENRACFCIIDESQKSEDMSYSQANYIMSQEEEIKLKDQSRNRSV